MMKITRKKLKEELHRLKVMLIQYRNDEAFTITIMREISRVKKELEIFAQMKKR